MFFIYCKSKFEWKICSFTLFPYAYKLYKKNFTFLLKLTECKVHFVDNKKKILNQLKNLKNHSSFEKKLSYFNRRLCTFWPFKIKIFGRNVQNLLIIVSKSPQMQLSQYVAAKSVKIYYPYCRVYTTVDVFVLILSRGGARVREKKR